MMAGAFERRLLEMDWKLVEVFDLERVDTDLLQEMVPSLTYALVTEVMCTSPRLTCKLICILQLVIEMFIQCRKHDAYDVQQLQEELSNAAAQRDSYRLRLKETQTDLKAVKGQLARSTTLLKSCGHVLHAHGCSPHAIAALEAVLSTPLATNAEMNAKVAHLCAFCGKAFASQEYLLKHIERRHPSSADTPEAEDTIIYSKQHKARSKPEFTDYQELLSKLESMLSQHEVSIRNVAAEETAKLQSLQSELSIENGIKAELNMARAAVTSRLDDAQKQLSLVMEEKEEALKQLLELKDEIAHLKKKQSMTPPPSEVVVTVPDVKDRLTIERLEAIVGQSKEALADARHDMKELHEKYDNLLVTHERCKFELVNVQAELEKYLSQQKAPKQTMNEACQTESSKMIEIASQTEQGTNPSEPTPAVEKICQTSQAVVLFSEACCQTDPMAQIAPVASIPPTILKEPEPIQDNIHIAAPELPAAKSNPIAPSIIQEQISSLPLQNSPQVTQPQKALPPQRQLDTPNEQVHEKSTAAAVQRYPLQRRPFLTSAWPHTPEAIDCRIREHLNKLETTCEGYGIAKTCLGLSEAQATIATTKFKGHLYVLKPEVLERMVDVDKKVQDLLETKWLPTEKTRQDNINRIRSRLDNLDQAQNEWIAQILKQKEPQPKTTLSKVLLNTGGSSSIQNNSSAQDMTPVVAHSQALPVATSDLNPIPSSTPSEQTYLVQHTPVAFHQERNSSEEDNEAKEKVDQRSAVSQASSSSQGLSTESKMSTADVSKPQQLTLPKTSPVSRVIVVGKPSTDSSKADAPAVDVAKEDSLEQEILPAESIKMDHDDQNEDANDAIACIKANEQAEDVKTESHDEEDTSVPSIELRESAPEDRMEEMDDLPSSTQMVYEDTKALLGAPTLQSEESYHHAQEVEEIEEVELSTDLYSPSQSIQEAIPALEQSQTLQSEDGSSVISSINSLEDSKQSSQPQVFSVVESIDEEDEQSPVLRSKISLRDSIKHQPRAQMSNPPTKSAFSIGATHNRWGFDDNTSFASLSHNTGRASADDEFDDDLEEEKLE